MISPTYFTGQSRIGAYTPERAPTFSECFQAAFRDLWRRHGGYPETAPEPIRSALSETAYEAASERFDPVAGAVRRGG